MKSPLPLAGQTDSTGVSLSHVLLAHLPMPVLMIDRSLKVMGMHSRAAVEVFGSGPAAAEAGDVETCLVGRDYPELLMPEPEQVEPRRLLREWLLLIFDRPDMGWDSLADLNPLETLNVERGGQKTEIHLQYTPLADNGSGINRLLVLGSDNADRRALEEKIRRQEEERQETFSALTQILRLDASTFRNFLSECRALVSESRARVAGLTRTPDVRDALDTLFRKFHTIKGNARVLQLKWIEESAHRCEDELAALREHPAEVTQADTKPISEALKSLREILKRYDQIARQALGSAADTGQTRSENRDLKVPVPVNRLDALQTLLTGGCRLVNQPLPAAEELLEGVTGGGRLKRLKTILNNALEAVNAIRREPARRLLRRFPKMVQDLANELGKEIEETVIHGGDLLVDVRLLDAIADPLIHMVRNAVDHGVETPDVRRERGKPPQGRIEIELRQHAGQLIAEVRDDGRGLDLQHIGRKAAELGLVDSREARTLDLNDAFDLLTQPGFSTRGQVGMISGRGVGLDVVRRTIEEMGGRFSLDAPPGRGCCARLWVPLHKEGGR